MDRLNAPRCHAICHPVKISPLHRIVNATVNTRQPLFRMTYGNTTQLKAIIIDSLQSRLALGMFKVFSRTGPPILGAAKSAIFQTALGLLLNNIILQDWSKVKTYTLQINMETF